MSAPAIGSLHTSITPVGSRITCDPAPADTDQDWLVFVPPEAFREFVEGLIASDWEPAGSLRMEDDRGWTPGAAFNSFRLGIENLIVTCHEDFHKRFLAASSVAKRLNLLEKADRIALFQAVLYGNRCDEEVVEIPELEGLA